MSRFGGTGRSAARTIRARLRAPRSALRRLARFGALAAASLISGCATYHALPLPRRAHLAGGLSALRTEVPPLEQGAAARRIEVNRPLSPGDIGLLAVLNDPALRTEGGYLAGAQAALLQASLLPNPVAGLVYEPQLGGAGVAPSWTATLSEDVAALITYHTRVKSARFAFEQVNAELLWREWQVAQQARGLALDLYWGNASLQASRREAQLLAVEARAARAAAASRSLDLTTLSSILAAEAAAEQNLASLRLAQLRAWQALDALLGLAPTVRFAIAAPHLPPVPHHLAPLLATLAERRPDLVALKLGYRSADEDVRTAIIGQFPALVLGAQWDQDNGNVRNGGPTAQLDLPLFDRNQGRIGATRATRRVLHAQYQARLDAAVGAVHGLAVQIRRLRRDVQQAHRSADDASRLARAARRAYASGAIDERSLTDYQSAALERRLEANTLESTLAQARIAITLELGLGLPQVRIVPAAKKS
ncbi:MAG: TolC family protein [Steroidobacteraceae bacterium]